MNSRFLYPLISLCLLPSVALAAEPPRGTVITVASIGLWVVFSSTGIAMRRKRDGRQKQGATEQTESKQS